MLQARWLTLPKLIRFMVMHFADGVAFGCGCALLMVWYDICNIGSLLESYGSLLLISLFFLQSGLLFGTLSMSVAVMNIGDDE